MKKKVKTPNLRQERFAKILAEGKCRTLAEGMRAVGYSDSVVDRPSVVTRTPSFQAVYAKYGLTPELVTSSLVEDIKNKKGQRISELTLASRVLGLERRNITGTVNTINITLKKEQKKNIIDILDAED